MERKLRDFYGTSKVIQKLINVLYRYPKSWYTRIRNFGGLMNYQRMLKSQKLMRKAYMQVNEMVSYKDGLTIYFLTGKNYIDQTVFCIASLTNVSNEKFNFILIDDGSFDNYLIDLISSKIKDITIIRKNELDSVLSHKFPENRYPFLNQKRREYAHIKKLLDVHSINREDWKLVLDSDMLFWKEPTEIIEWLKNPETPIHMIDCIEAYGYTKTLIDELAATTVQNKINVGVIGLNSNKLNWDKIESWIMQLESTEGKSYYLEQALTAMIIGDQDAIKLNTRDYIVSPSKNNVIHETGILHHYVDTSKAHYFNIAWKKILQND